MKNKVILITGGTSGIGKSLVGQLHKENQVIVCSTNLNRIKECQKQFENVEFLQCDILSSDQLIKVRKNVSDKYGHIDILINSAGTATSFNA